MFFKKKKAMIESSIDISRKGDIDRSIMDLIKFINSHDDYITTSSCSGRIIVISKDGGDNCKKECKWIVTSHEVVEPADIVEKLKCFEKNMVFKFEPFILHVHCQNSNAAKRMQNCALAAGFRNSGSVFGRNGSIVFAVRGTHGLEVPLSDDQGLIVTDDYIKYITEKANSKMIENQKKIERFSKAVYAMKTSQEQSNVD